MPVLSQNIRNRVHKLPKPTNASQALQPLFEAVSNAFYAIEDRGAEGASPLGDVRVDIINLTNPHRFRVEISDNGIGLDADRYHAFQTIDTDFKRDRGGKGVGRLFWLDAFERVLVESRYLDGDKLERRCFRFELNNDEQIVEEHLENGYVGRTERGTTVICEGLRGASYQKWFPKQSPTFLRYFSAHFIADFLIGGGARVRVTLDGDPTEYPSAISDLVIGRDLETGDFEVGEYGTFSVRGFACDKESSTGLEGNHQLHLLANGRTVESRKVDGLMGLATIASGDRNDLFFHGCVSSDYLNERVNEGRTAFNVPEAILKEISRKCVEQVRETVLADQMLGYERQRRTSYADFVARHPIYDFDDPDIQLQRVPFNAQTPEEFATGLVKFQIRRDEERQEAMQRVIDKLSGSDEVPVDFAESVINAAESIQRSEHLALAQHVVRRKLVLDLMENLIRRVKAMPDGTDTFHLEKTLHSLICPMNIRGDDHLSLESRQHDLWIVDERLAFTRAFSSDKRLDKVLKEGGSKDRPDLFLWNMAYGMGVIDPYRGDEDVDTSQPLQKVMVVEFKRPGRREYAKAEDQIESQIARYLGQLKGGEIESFGRDRVRIADDCIFYCYVVADIVGDLEDQLSTWTPTANKQGRIRSLDGKFRGVIEVIQWRDLVSDAWMRNQATLHAAGLRRG